MTLNLVSLDFQAPVCEVTLNSLPAVIGHSPDADVRVEHHSVGSKHCRIDWVDGELVVDDLDTVHGTFVEGARIRRAVLRSGCRLAIGLVSFLVQSLPEAGPAAPLEESLLTGVT
jgi:pSer/pThr/pTyr-binding forkhead associated (FHA) protein